MSGFKEFNRITTDYAEVLNVLFKDFIQFVALQYRSKLINSNDIKKLIDSESHNDLSITLNKYKQPIWQHKDLREDKFSLQKLINSSSKFSPRSDHLIGSITAFTSSPNSSFGTPMTAQSALENHGSERSRLK